MRLNIIPNRNGNENQIHAIRTLRGLTGWGLQQTKTFYDRIRYSSTPSLITTVDNITVDNLRRIPGIEANAYDFFNIEIIVENIINQFDNFMKGHIPRLLDIDAPEVLQASILFYNAIRKHLKNNPDL